MDARRASILGAKVRPPCGPTSRYHPVSRAPRDARLMRSQRTGAMTRPGHGGQSAEPTQSASHPFGRRLRGDLRRRRARSLHHPPLACDPHRSDYSSPSMPLRSPASSRCRGDPPKRRIRQRGDLNAARDSKPPPFRSSSPLVGQLSLLVCDTSSATVESPAVGERCVSVLHRASRAVPYSYGKRLGNR